MTEAQYDPIKDEDKKFSLDEWGEALVAEIQRYVRDSKDMNAYHKEKHTFTEWMATFGRYMSW